MIDHHVLHMVSRIVFGIDKLDNTMCLEMLQLECWLLDNSFDFDMRS